MVEAGEWFVPERWVGKTLETPKQDGKWQRGRTRRSLAFGVCTRHNKVTGSPVAPVPDDLVGLLHEVGVLADMSAPALDRLAVLVEEYQPGQWCPPRAEPEAELAQPTVALALGAPVELHLGTATTTVGDATFGNVDQVLVLQPGQHAVLTPGCKFAVGRSVTETPYLVLVRWLATVPPAVQRRRDAARMQHSKPQVRAVPVPDEPAEAALQTPDLERTNVQAVYEDIAGHWDHTRHSPWPRVADFLGKLAPGSLVADVGCGNGKYMLVAPPQCVMLGSDVCRGLVELCGEKGLEVATGDNMTLPYRDGVFDAAISIAVLHHFSSAARRRRAIWELARIVRPGGLVLVQAWALEQGAESKREFPAQDIFVPWVHNAEFEQNRAPVAKPASSDEASTESAPRVYERYCHVYCEGELGELVESTAQFEVQECFYDASNWCVIAQRCT